jgi:hypothetical protein
MKKCESPRGPGNNSGGPPFSLSTFVEKTRVDKR